MAFKEININELQINPFNKIGKEWMLITAGNSKDYNTMTASWGSMGVLWNKNVVFAFVRPQRHTFGYMENSEYFSLSFYPENMKNALTFCGTHSGKDVNKAKETGLIAEFDQNAPYFKQASLVFICKKIHAQYLDPTCFLDENINKNYDLEDYHKIYIGEIEKVLINE